jgi:hypothetical protein
MAYIFQGRSRAIYLERGLIIDRERVIIREGTNGEGVNIEGA